MRTAAALVMLACAPARADSNDIVARPLTLEPDQLELHITAELELARRQFARPLSIAPDLWLGVTPRWTAGIIHSNAAIDRIERAASYCFRHTDIGCERTYSAVGLDVRYSAITGALAVAPRARFLVRDVDPWKPAVTAGALVRWTRGRVAIASDPYLRLGLANTERGNRAAVFVPVEFTIQPIRRVAVAMHTGYDSDLAVWYDGFHIPFAFALRVRVTAHFELSALAGLTSAFGPQDTVNRRVLWLALGWRS